MRLAAERALARLQKATLSELEGAGTGEALLPTLLPLILHTGLTSSVESVRVARSTVPFPFPSRLRGEQSLPSLSMLTELAKSGRGSVGAHAGVVVPALLRSLSELEPALLNYLAVRADDEAAAGLDAARSAAARSSPSMDAARALIPRLTPQAIKGSPTLSLAPSKGPALPELTPSLSELLRSSGSGLATRTGTASFVQALVNVAPRELIGAGKTCSGPLPL